MTKFSSKLYTPDYCIDDSSARFISFLSLVPDIAAPFVYPELALSFSQHRVIPAGVRLIGCSGGFRLVLSIFFLPQIAPYRLIFYNLQAKDFRPAFDVV